MYPAKAYIGISSEEQGANEVKMDTTRKLKKLSIRVPSVEKLTLLQAAELQALSLNSFVLSTALEAANEVVPNQTQIKVSKQTYDWLIAKLEEPPQDLPGLRALFSRPSVFESQS